MRAKARDILRHGAELALKLALVFVAVTTLQVLVVRFVDPPLTPTVAQRALQHALAGGGLAWPDHRTTSLEEVGDTVARAFVASEDGRFFLHGGFDWEGICDAV